MKLTIEKTAKLTIDTAAERERIRKAFRNDKETRDHLNAFMDLVEACKWESALAELNTKWWQGRDKEQGCPRLEFIGFVRSRKLSPSAFFDPWMTYMDLVVNMYEYPKNYKMIVKEMIVKEKK